MLPIVPPLYYDALPFRITLSSSIPIPINLAPLFTSIAEHQIERLTLISFTPETSSSSVMGDGQTVNGQAIAIISVSAIMSFLAVLTVILRFVARAYAAHHYYLDDYLIVGALVSHPAM